MSNDQYPPSEPQPQPYATPRGPEFGGPGYDPYRDQPLTAPTPPPAQPASPYLPPVASAAPVVPPTRMQSPYGYPVPYQQPYYGYQMARPEHPSSGTVLVLGILSVFVAVTGPFAWYLGSRAKKEIALGAPYQWGAGGQVGWILGIVYSVFLILFAAVIMLAITASL